MYTLSNTFAGASTWEVNIAGKYFTLLACNAPCNVRFYKGGKKLDLGEINGLLSGLEVTLGDMHDEQNAFDRVQIDSTGADTVQIGIGNGQSRYNRGGQSSVTITNACGPYSNASATVTTAAATLVAASGTRRYVAIQNRDASGNIFINFGGTATSANGLKIPPGGTYESADFCPNNAISAIGDIASNANIIVITG